MMNRVSPRDHLSSRSAPCCSFDRFADPRTSFSPVHEFHDLFSQFFSRACIAASLPWFLYLPNSHSGQV